jgi:hypothetical protein
MTEVTRQLKNIKKQKGKKKVANSLQFQPQLPGETRT